MDVRGKVVKEGEISDLEQWNLLHIFLGYKSDMGLALPDFQIFSLDFCHSKM